MDEHDDLVVALTPLIDVLDRLGVAWYVGGSVASTVHGRFRATNDVDVIANLRDEHASQLRAELEADHYVDEESIRDAVRHQSSFNLVHFETGLKIDVFVATDSEYEAASNGPFSGTRAAIMWGESRLWVLPIAWPDARLLQNSLKQRRTDLSAVSVGNGQPVLASRHVEMLSASYRTLEAELPPASDQFTMRNGRYFRHQAASASTSLISNGPKGGIGSDFLTLTRSHPSTTSFSSRRHASSVAPDAQTPGKSGTSP